MSSFHEKEIFSISNNTLQAIPCNVCYLNALEVLDISNNKLERVPTELHSIVSPAVNKLFTPYLIYIYLNLHLITTKPCLKNFDCTGNSTLTTIPKAMQTESSLALWTLRFHHVYKEEITLASKNYEDIESQVKRHMIEVISIEEEEAKLHEEVMALERERPSKYIRRRTSFILFQEEFKLKFVQLIFAVSEWCQKLFKKQKGEKAKKLTA